MAFDKVSYSGGLSLVKQVANSISRDIEAGVFKRNQKLLSINIYSKKYGVARDTIEKAYISLKKEGYITSINGKGYFVIGKPDARIKVLMLFNKLSSYKKMVYDSVLKTLGDRGKVDLYIHHYNPVLLEESIDQNLDNYHYFVVMPHFFQESDEKECLRILKKIPRQQLILLDKQFKGLETQSAVYQDFRNDIYTALKSVVNLVNKYKEIEVVFPPDRNHPVEILDGLKQFCKEHKRKLEIISKTEQEDLKRGALYIVLTEIDLANLIKQSRALNYTLGKDLGIISFNETVFKELLDITVITTDFEEMGKIAAGLIMNNEHTIIKNTFKIIIRSSL
jgi:DNA-binding transcriptional regulator YhcF (GntR family)